MFIIKIAELKIRVNNIYSFSYEFCKDYIVETDEYDFEVTPTVELIQNEHDESLPYDYPLPYCESIVIYRLIALRLYKFNSFVMHGALISVNDEGFIFLAKSGVGKTTHLRMYLDTFKEKAEIINGDKPIIKYIDGKFYGYGTPYNGKENMGVNKRVEIKGICFLKRGSINKAYETNKDEASTLIFNQILLPNNMEDYDILINLLNIFISKINTISLECNLDKEACLVSYRALGGKIWESKKDLLLEN